MSSAPKKYGFRVFVGSCIFSALTIGFYLFFYISYFFLLVLVLYDEHLQRERRQASVKYRLNTIKQQENMADYQLQKQRYEEYKTQNS